MPDNTTLNPGAGGDLIATDELTTLNGGAVSGVKAQRVKLGFGVDGTLQDVTAAAPLPVTVANFPGTQPVSGAVSVSGTVAVSGPLTDTQLRAANLDVAPNVTRGSGVTDANTQRVTLASDGPAVTALTNIDADLGAPADAAAAADGTGNYGVIAGIKRALLNWANLLARMPAALGQTTMAGSLPVTLASNQSALPVTLGGVAAITGNPLETTPALPVVQKPVQIWTASFADVGSGLISSLFTQRRVGTGWGVSQANGNLLITSGTTANADFLARSIVSHNGAMIQRFQTILSQRIVNNNFAVMLADRIGEGLAYNCTSATVVDVTLAAHGFTAANVGQSINLGGVSVSSGTAVPGRYAITSIPDANTIRFTVAGWATGTGTLDLFGWNYYRALYNGTAPTNVALDAQRNGWASGDTTAAVNTSASPGHMLQLAVDGRNAAWADSLVASVATPSLTTRASRMVNLPDANTELFVYIWCWNGTTAPASTTTFTLGFISVEDAVNNAVYLAGVRQMGQTAPLPVAVGAGTANIGNVTLLGGSATIGNVTRILGYSDSSTTLGASATFLGTGRATTIGNNFCYFKAVAFADQAGTFSIELSTDTGTTYRQIASVAVAANIAQTLSVPVTGVAPGGQTLYRVRFVNGGVAQGAFQISSSFTAA